MKKAFEFIKTTAIGGLLVIIPLSISLFVLVQLYRTLVGFIEAFVDSLPVEMQNDADVVFLLTILSIVAACFITGLLVQTRLGIALRRWARRTIANRIPMYNALTSLTKRVVGVDGAQFAPVEIELLGSGVRTLGFVIEALPEERCAVYVPSAPLVTAGQVYVVPAANIHPVNASMSETMAVISQWGVDAHALYANKTQAAE